jgi:membrane associated rhomboid family serine protease
MRRPFLDRPVALLGQYLPMASLALIVFTVLGSALLSLTTRLGVPSIGLALLSPALVIEGQVWRLVTWAFFDLDGQNLVFGALMLGFFGRDLAALWGGARYLIVCLGVALFAGTLTTLVGFAWGDVARSQYLSIWPLADALAVAWAVLFPNRTILFMFVLPAAGRNLLYATVGITALFAVMYGFSNFVPHFLAMGAMYAYIRGGTVLAAQLKLNRLLAPKRTNPGLKVVDGGWNKDSRKGPNDSRWVH